MTTLRILTLTVSVLAALFFSACGPAAPTPTVIPTPRMAAQAIPSPTVTPSPSPTQTSSPSPTLQPSPTLHPLMIAALRQGIYPGSDLSVDQDLENGVNYTRQIVSYRSEGLRIYALLTVPLGKPPQGGWPVIIFNHGYIPPEEYRPTERYVAYVDALARSGYIVLRPDYRGNGNSEGRAGGAYSRPDYTIDVLNAVASIKRYPLANPQRIGMWGHSMGGYITLRVMVTSRDIKAGVIWGGVVGSYPDLLTLWNPTPPASISAGARSWRSQFLATFGTPEENPAFWRAISSDSYLGDLSGPLQLHHAEGDETVPAILSQRLYDKAQSIGAPVELYLYPGDNHNLSANFSLAMQRTLDFFNQILK